MSIQNFLCDYFYLVSLILTCFSFSVSHVFSTFVSFFLFTLFIFLSVYLYTMYIYYPLTFSIVYLFCSSFLSLSLVSIISKKICLSIAIVYSFHVAYMYIIAWKKVSYFSQLYTFLYKVLMEVNCLFYPRDGIINRFHTKYLKIDAWCQ